MPIKTKSRPCKCKPRSRWTCIRSNLVGKKIKFKAADGTFADYSAASLGLTNEKGDTLALSSITAGQAGNLYFTGQTASSFKVLNVTVGRIASVATDKVTVTDYNGNAVIVPLSANYSVVKNGVQGSTASVLAAGDRVIVKLDEKDRLLITVNGGTAKTFWKYDAASRMLSVKKTSLNELNTYTVTTATKITQNGASIAISQLADGDSIVLYFLQGYVSRDRKSVA